MFSIVTEASISSTITKEDPWLGGFGGWFDVQFNSSNNWTDLGFTLLKNLDIPTIESSYWIGAGALLGFVFLFHIMFTVALMYLQAPSNHFQGRSCSHGWSCY